MTARALTVLAAVAAISILAPPAQAKKKRARSSALFPVNIKGAADEALVRGIEQEIINKARNAGVGLIYGPTLAKRIRDAAQAVRRCADNGVCLGKLGKRARVSEVIAGKAVAARGGVRLTFRIVDVGSNRVVRKAQLEVVQAAQIEMTVSASFVDLFGVADASETADDLVMPALEDLSLPAAGPTAGEQPVASAAHAGPSDGSKADLVPLVALEAPPNETTGGAGATETVNARRGSDGVAGQARVSPGRGVSYIDGTTAAPVTAAEPSRTMLYAGVAIAATGAIATGIGAIFGLLRNDAEAAIKRKNPPLSQIAAATKGQEGTANADRANALYIAGGAALVVGALLMGIDAIVFADDDTGATVGSDGSGARPIVRW